MAAADVNDAAKATEVVAGEDGFVHRPCRRHHPGVEELGLLGVLGAVLPDRDPADEQVCNPEDGRDMERLRHLVAADHAREVAHGGRPLNVPSHVSSAPTSPGAP